MGLITDAQMRNSVIEGDPIILTHPNIPKPLHGVNPRTHMGQKWWDKQRKIAYAEHDNHCHACGQHVAASLRSYLEAHEWYEYNYKTGEVKLYKIVALCHECHSFIHSGLLSHKLDKFEITHDFYDYIMDRGTDILWGADLQEKWDGRNNKIDTCSIEWNDWHMSMPDGKVVHPDLKSYEEWERFYSK